MLSKFFGSRGQLYKLAHGNDPNLFLRTLAAADIFVLSVPFSSDLDPETMTAGQLAGVVEASTANLANNESGFEPFTYQVHRKATLPFFSSETFAQQFIDAYVSRVRKIIPFHVLGVRGDTLPSVMDVADRWILNAETKQAVDCTKHLNQLFDKLR